MEHENQIRLIPAECGDGELHASFLPLCPPPSAKNYLFSFVRGLLTAVCAAACICFVTAVFLCTLLFLSETDFTRIALRLSGEAFLGSAVLDTAPAPTVTEPFLPLPAETPDEKPELSDSSDEQSEPPEETASDADPQLKRYPIEKTDLSNRFGLLTLTNETGYKPDTKALLGAALPFPSYTEWKKQYGENSPYVLILHTHGTESYAAENASTYSPDESFRSHDPQNSVVAVGQAMTETLAEAGIPTLHCTEMFDAQSYQDSYSRAAAAIREYLREYPSIQIILDVHRDSVIRSDMARMQPVTEIDGEEYAQLMIVAGTDYQGANFPHWQENLNFALKLQQALTAKKQSLMRAVNLRGAAFNEQYRSGSLLLEVGSCGNTLPQAKRTGILAARTLAELILG